MIVNSCDAYQDVLPLFYCALDEYWPNRQFDVVINAESVIDQTINNKALLTSLDRKESKSWGLRLLKTLANIETEYVIMAYDDYILESSVDVNRVNNIVGFMDENPNSAVFYLNAVCYKSHIDDEAAAYRQLKDKVDYRLNSAPAVWRRKDLMKYVGENDDPWVWEVFGTYRTFGDGKEFYSQSSAKNNIYDYPYQKGGAVYRGKWVSDVVVPKSKKYNLDIDFSKRGFSDNRIFEKRDLAWKVRFLWLGFNMVGFKMLYFVINALKAKLNA
ncbi:MAG: hypothetical protein ISEC1_P0823 [Thiomicrorhabdus sp.]|nr:MAG: hypothetical protein ISEC1_P0823 [Thiomicrorhabdus sp.]